MAGIIPVPWVAAVQGELGFVEYEELFVGLIPQCHDIGSSWTEDGEDDVVAELVQQTGEQMGGTAQYAELKLSNSASN